MSGFPEDEIDGTKVSDPYFVRVQMLLPLIVLVAASCAQPVPSSLHAYAKSRTSAPDFSVGTYNLYVGNRDLKESVAVIRKMDADMVALQEVTADSAAFLKLALARDYPHQHFASGRNDSGRGFISRVPLKQVRFEQSRSGINGFGFAEMHQGKGRVQILNLHLEPLQIFSPGDVLELTAQFGRQRNIQKSELDQALGHLKPDRPTIILGDFNRLGNDALRKLRQLGYEDSLAAVQPRANAIATLNFSILGIHGGRRIDFIFHDRHFRTVESAVFAGSPSDHNALAIRLAWE